MAIDFSDSDSKSTHCYSSPDDDDYNISDGEEELDEELFDDDDEGLESEDEKTPGRNVNNNKNNNDKEWLSTQPASQSATKTKRISPRRKTMQTQQQQKQKQKPPMKKRKVSLSPTDSLAKHRPSLVASKTEEEIIDLLADDDDDSDSDSDSDDEVLAIKRDRIVTAEENTNPPQAQLSPSMLAAASKQQKVHVQATKQKHTQQQNKTNAKPPAKQKLSKVKEVSYADCSKSKYNSKNNNASSKSSNAKEPTTSKTKAKKSVSAEESKPAASKPAVKAAKAAKTKTKSNTKDSEAVKSANVGAQLLNNTNAANTKRAKAATTTTATAAAKPPPKKKKKRTTFEEELLQKMFLSCRPYSVRDLMQLMGKTTSEASVTFCLLSLIDKKWAIKKEFKSGNRTKELYWANQESKDKTLWALDCLQLPSSDRIGQTRMELAALQQQQKLLSREIVEIEKTPSNERLSVLCQSAEAEVDKLSSQLKAMEGRIADSSESQLAAGTTKPPGRFGTTKFGTNNKSNNLPIKTKTKTPLQLKKRINGLRDHWIKRKRKCMDFVDSLADGMDKTVKDVVNKVLELETDESEHAVLPPKYVL